MADARNNTNMLCRSRQTAELAHSQVEAVIIGDEVDSQTQVAKPAGTPHL
jgi:hypothetical protein